MANEPAFTLQGVADQAGENASRLVVQGFPGAPPSWTAPTIIDMASFVQMDRGPETKAALAAPRQQNFSGAICQDEVASDFFDNVIVTPQLINTGIVVGVLNFVIDVYSSYRHQVRTFDSFSSTAGDGVSITDLPTLPSTMPAQSGFTLTLEVLPEGPATINGDLDFDFDVGFAVIAILGTRAVTLPNQPSKPIIEILQFRTDILRKSHGSEQRRKLRFAPRQIFELPFSVSGHERRVLETAMMGAQGRALGVPVWHEATLSTAPVSISDTTINVDTTAFADYRVGGLARIWSNVDTFETLEVLTINPTSLVFNSQFTKAFPAGALVMPERTAFMSREVTGVKFPVNLQETRMRVTVIDNDSDLSSAAAFPTFNSKVFLNEPNMIRGRLSETISRDTFIIDSVVGTLDQFSDEVISRRSHLKIFFSRTRQRLWEVRQLLHFLGGRQTSFYIPTFFDELEPTANIVSASDKLTIKNIGYSDQLQSRTPRDAVQLVKTDGTKVARSVLSSLELSETEEQLTLGATWGVNATLAEILRVEYVEKVRLDSDEVRITHTSDFGEAEIEAPIITVNE